MTRRLALLSLVLPLVACDKTSEPESTAPETVDAAGASGTGEPGSPDVPWEEKNHQQRMEFMGLVVYPSMKEAFAGFDGARFAEFKCQTCHGDDAKEVNYHMPNAVTPLSKSDPVGDGNGIDPAITKFMLETVVPTMQEHLKGDEVDCHSCHLEG